MMSENGEVKSEKKQIRVKLRETVEYQQVISVTDEELRILEEHGDDRIYFGSQAFEILQPKIDHTNIIDSDGEYRDFNFTSDLEEVIQ